MNGHSLSALQHHFTIHDNNHNYEFAIIRFRWVHNKNT